MSRTVVVSGGLGFIGFHISRHLLAADSKVVALDNLSREGSGHRLTELLKLGRQFTFIQTDLTTDSAVLAKSLAGCDAVIHCAGQVSAAESWNHPLFDLQVNAGGAIRLFEAAARSSPYAPIIYFSSNKVYGPLEGLRVREKATRYEFHRESWLGVNEQQPVSPSSPYAVSKLAGERYLALSCTSRRSPGVVLRLSCVYGEYQWGNEGQGWISHFLRASIQGQPLKIFGDGKQVRDALYIADLVDLVERMLSADLEPGLSVWNVGGGRANSVSVWREFAHYVSAMGGSLPPVIRVSRTEGDQLVYISDTRRARAKFGWQPTVPLATGLKATWSWLGENVSPNNGNSGGGHKGQSD